MPFVEPAPKRQKLELPIRKSSRASRIFAPYRVRPDSTMAKSFNLMTDGRTCFADARSLHLCPLRQNNLPDHYLYGEIAAYV